MTTKQFYQVILETIVTEPRIIKIFPSVNFKYVFQRLHDPFIDINIYEMSCLELFMIFYLYHITCVILVFTKIISAPYAMYI